MKLSARIVFYFLTLPLWADAQEHTISQYTVVEGLPQSEVNSLAEDEFGYLWVGTQGGGLSRFDGKEFKAYTTRDGLLNNSVGHVHIDQRGNIWTTHTKGLSRFDGATFKTFEVPDSLSSGRITRVTEYQDTIFFTSLSGHIGKIYKDSLYYWKAKPYGSLIYRAHQVSTQEIILLLYDGRLILRTPGLDRIMNVPLSVNEIESLSFLTSSNKRFVVFNHEFYEINAGLNQLTPLGYGYEAQFLFYDETDQAYWAASGTSLLKLRLTDGSFASETILTEVVVNQLYRDSEENVWIATNGSGLYKYFLQDFYRFDLGDVKAVLAVMRDRDGSVWGGSYVRGIFRINEGKTKFFTSGNASKDAVTSLLQTADGTIWAGTYGGLAKYDVTLDRFRWLSDSDGFPATAIFNLNEDDDGRLWVGTRSGLFVYDSGRFSNVPVQSKSPIRFISSAHYSNFHKSLFFGFESDLFQLDNKLYTRSVSSLQNSSALTIQSYQDSLLLIGTSGNGMLVFSPVRGALATISVLDGLPSDFIYFVKVDEKESIWIGTEKGITKITLTNQFQVNSVIQYNHYNGLSGVETNQNAVYFDDEVKLFGLIDGLYQQNSKAKKKFAEKPIHLTDVKLFYGDQSFEGFAKELEGFYDLPIGLNLPSTKNHLTFDFNKINKRHPHAVRFKYKLEGFDGEWSLPTSSRTVTYSNLPPAKYVFRIKATNHNGLWEADDIIYAFEIRAPFVQTPLFMLLMSVAVLALIIGFFYWRMRLKLNRLAILQQIRQEEHERIRKEIARDFHDDMGNQLTRIINYVSLLRLNGNRVKTEDLYSKVEGSAKYLYTGTRDFIWAIDPVNDALSNLFLHLRDFAEKMFDERDINFRAYNRVKEEIKLPYGYSRQINLLFKEVMTNSFRHSQASNVRLSMALEDGQISIVFEDDGKGFDMKKSLGSGLRNMHERAERMKGKLIIESSSGTSVKLLLTVNKNIHGKRI